MAKSKKAVVVKKQKVQKAPKIKVVPKVQKKAPEVKKAVEAKVKKVQPKIVQPKAKAKKVQPEVKKKQVTVKKRDEGETSKGVENKEIFIFSPLVELTKVKHKDELPLNVSEMTIIEIMHQKNLSREDAISFIKNNQRK